MLSADAGVVHDIREVLVAPAYQILPSPAAPETPELSSAKNDLATVLLDTPVVDVPPLRPLDSPARPGTPITFFGHAITSSHNKLSDVLQRGELTVRADSDCAAATPAVVDRPSVLCTRDTRSPSPTNPCRRASAIAAARPSYATAPANHGWPGCSASPWRQRVSPAVHRGSTRSPTSSHWAAPARRTAEGSVPAGQRDLRFYAQWSGAASAGPPP